MRIRNIILFVFLITLYINCIYGQHPNKVEQTILFSSKIDNPIKIEVLDKGDKLQFYAHNRSYYSYQLI